MSCSRSGGDERLDRELRLVAEVEHAARAAAVDVVAALEVPDPDALAPALDEQHARLLVGARLVRREVARDQLEALGVAWRAGRRRRSWRILPGRRHRPVAVGRGEQERVRAAAYAALPGAVGRRSRCSSSHSAGRGGSSAAPRPGRSAAPTRARRRRAASGRSGRGAPCADSRRRRPARARGSWYWAAISCATRRRSGPQGRRVDRREQRHVEPVAPLGRAHQRRRDVEQREPVVRRRPSCPPARRARARVDRAADGVGEPLEQRSARAAAPRRAPRSAPARAARAAGRGRRGRRPAPPASARRCRSPRRRVRAARPSSSSTSAAYRSARGGVSNTGRRLTASIGPLGRPAEHERDLAEADDRQPAGCPRRSPLDGGVERAQVDLGLQRCEHLAARSSASGGARRIRSAPQTCRACYGSRAARVARAGSYQRHGGPGIRAGRRRRRRDRRRCRARGCGARRTPWRPARAGASVRRSGPQEAAPRWCTVLAASRGRA